MLKPGYKAFLKWIALEDDTNWLDDDEPIPSVTASMVMELFGVPEDKFFRDLRRELDKVRGA